MLKLSLQFLGRQRKREQSIGVWRGKAWGMEPSSATDVSLPDMSLILRQTACGNVTVI